MVRDGGRVVQGCGQRAILRFSLHQVESAASWSLRKLLPITITAYFCGSWGWLSRVEEKGNREDEESRQEESQRWNEGQMGWGSVQVHPPTFPSCRCWDALLNRERVLKYDWREWPVGFNCLLEKISCGTRWGWETLASCPPLQRLAFSRNIMLSLALEPEDLPLLPNPLTLIIINYNK